MTDNIISMTKINKFYDDFHVLKNIDFSVKKGEIVVVCGPSGSGKSTLIRCINGLEDIDDGDIIVDNIDIHASKKNLQAIRSEVGMVFQHFNLFPHLTILENITIAPTLVKNMNKKEVKQIAMDLLEKVKLADKANSYPADLSGGQKQRVSLCRALMKRPKILLMDEPLSALDTHMRVKLQDEILALHKEFGTTTIMVSHDPSEMYKLASRVLVLKDGKIIDDGLPKDILLKTQGSQKFSFEGVLLDIIKVDVINIAIVAIGQQIVEVVLSHDEARKLQIGQKVNVSTKAFTPIIKTL